MSSSKSTPLPVLVLIKFAMNVALVWFLSHYFSPFFKMTGGFGAYIVIGALITLMNIIVRPLLALVTLPLKLFATILAIIIVNGVFVQLIVEIVKNMDADVVSLTIGGGLIGWAVVAVILGIGNWLMKATLK